MGLHALALRLALAGLCGGEGGVLQWDGLPVDKLLQGCGPAARRAPAQEKLETIEII